MNTTRIVCLSLFTICLGLLFGQCKKAEMATPVTPAPPDPLINAAGTYTGTMTDTGRLYPTVKATVTTAKDNAGKLYISSIGFSSTTYQLVLAGQSRLSGRVGAYEYRTSAASADGKSLNVTGRYTLSDRWGVASAIYYDFSFTGTR